MYDEDYERRTEGCPNCGRLVTHLHYGPDGPGCSECVPDNDCEECQEGDDE